MVASFRAHLAGNAERIVRFVASYSMMGPVVHALGTEDPAEMRAILAAYSIDRLEADPEFWQRLSDIADGQSLDIEVDDAWVADLSLSGTLKQCDRQVEVGRDLWCDAAGSKDKTADFSIDGRLAAPTSAPICTACDVPDARLRCSAFMHPSVIGIRGGGALHQRVLSWAICNEGHQDRVVGHPEWCVPETVHQCWHRAVEIGPEDPAVLLDPLTLPDTLDHLNDVWRVAFGSHVVAIHSSVDVASLALEAGTRERFMDRLRALAEILGDLAVGDSVLSDDTPDRYRVGSLNRLETAIRSLASGEDESEVIANRIDVLRRALRLDNALQHPTGEPEFRSWVAGLDAGNRV